MLADGTPHAVDRLENYILRMESTGYGIPLTGISYDSGSYITTITFDNTGADWLPGTDYVIIVRGNLRNLCNVLEPGDVILHFRTVDGS